MQSRGFAEARLILGQFTNKYCWFPRGRDTVCTENSDQKNTQTWLLLKKP